MNYLMKKRMILKIKKEIANYDNKNKFIKINSKKNSNSEGTL